MRRGLRSFFALLLFPFLLNAGSPGKIKFGVENEYRSPTLFLAPSFLIAIGYYHFGLKFEDPYKFDFFAKRIQRRLLEYISKHGDGCTVEGQDVVYESRDFKFQVKIDVGVIELTHQPLTTSQFAELQPLIQRDMFDLPIAFGLYQSRLPVLASAHLHMDLEDAFGGDAKLFRNFIVDFVNHRELYNGALGYDPMEGKDIFRDLERFKQFQDLIKAFDRDGNWTFEKLQQQLADIGLVKISRTNKKPMINIKTKFGTLEFRALNPFRSSQDLYLVMHLIENRIEQLKSSSLVSLKPTRENSSLSELSFSFRDYVVGAGLRWLDYQHFLPKKWQKEMLRSEPNCIKTLELIARRN